MPGRQTAGRPRASIHPRAAGRLLASCRLPPGGRLLPRWPGQARKSKDIRATEVGTVPARQDLPSTLRRSSPKAQDTWIKTHDSAVGEYGEGQRAHRVAFAALKHSFEKVGDHWEEKGRKGPSDPQAARSIRDKPVPTAGGVDANATKEHLLEVARRLDIKGRSSMTKDKLVQAIKKSNTRKTATTRSTANARSTTNARSTAKARKTTNARTTANARKTASTRKATNARTPRGR
ncbi:hypothetical protein Raf01_28500 [Rugosimonospora africana]|uniref:Rho termination factor N-terminal domain-containing protein n=1 Tax=Rugosimonospora africana TaxID=556532 RepID=A0A8J3QS90_9ACTN|nr:hypothetical protein Raf01_28500 [Rugosimonospora africana]